MRVPSKLFSFSLLVLVLAVSWRDFVRAGLIGIWLCLSWVPSPLPAGDYCGRRPKCVVFGLHTPLTRSMYPRVAPPQIPPDDTTTRAARSIPTPFP